LYNYPYLNWQKPLVLPITAYTLSSTKLEIRVKEFLPDSEGVGGEREGAGGIRERVGEGGRNDPNIVCTYE
jgi:hypothetical protein